jgi:hypothetical protein
MRGLSAPDPAWRPIPQTYRVPDEAGLVDWLKQGLDEATTLVAEHDGRVLGFVAARLLEPDPDAPFQIERELAGRRLAIVVA